MTYKRKQLPKYCRHKASNRAFVRIGGKTYYLGKYGSDASRREYDRIIAEFIANGRQTLNDPDDALIESLIVRFLDYAEKDVNYSISAKARISRSLRYLNDLYGKQPISKFSPMALKTIRQRFVEDRLSRDTVNKYISTIKQIFYWGGEEELVPAEIVAVLRTVSHLKAGRTSAVDYDDIKPVDNATVEKTLPYLCPQIQDMIKIQRFISGRPQDVFNMRPCDIDTSGEVWRYVPFTHKTKKRGEIRELPIGPKAQQILLPYLEKCKDEPSQFIFPPPKAKYGWRKYNHVITLACKKAGVPHWTPNQLRHAGGTEVREKFGLDYAQAVLGHANAKTTEIYAKVSFEKAAKVAKEIG